MEESEIKLIRDAVLSNEKLSELLLKYCFELSTKDTGQFLSLIWESYKIGLIDAKEWFSCRTKFKETNRKKWNFT